MVSNIVLFSQGTTVTLVIREKKKSSFSKLKLGPFNIIFISFKTLVIPFNKSSSIFVFTKTTYCDECTTMGQNKHVFECSVRGDSRHRQT